MEKWSSSFSDELAERWDEYVDCMKRLQTEAPFLRRILASYKDGIIVDAALGLGCEAIYLIQHGFNVVGNEFDKRMRKKAEQVAERRGVVLKTTSVDWRQFQTCFERNSVDAVIIVGNSLCLLRTAEERKSVSAQIFQALRPGGVFIVDQRNFDYMFEKRREILSGRFKYSSRFMYCQKGIEGRPTIIEPSRVRISCFEKNTNGLLGYFDVYPFRGDELQRLLQSVGFKKIERYFDFHKEIADQWDFATMVCYKDA